MFWSLPSVRYTSCGNCWFHLPDHASRPPVEIRIRYPMDRVPSEYRVERLAQVLSRRPGKPFDQLRRVPRLQSPPRVWIVSTENLLELPSLNMPGGEKGRRSSGIPMTTFDDVSRLATLLSECLTQHISVDTFCSSCLASLASLLGLLGHTLAKVNALKVLRALLRHRDESVNGESPLMNSRAGCLQCSSIQTTSHNPPNSQCFTLSSASTLGQRPSLNKRFDMPKAKPLK